MASVPNWLEQLKIRPIPFCSFCPNGVIQAIPKIYLNEDELVKKSQAESADFKYKSDLIDLYRQHDIHYPPKLSELPPDFEDMCEGLLLREEQVASFLDHVQPYLDTCDTPEFVDLNLSPQFALNADHHGYTTTIPCLCTQSKILKRVELTSGRKVWRVLHRELLLQLVGFGKPIHSYPAKLVSKLTGNAFSGFSCGPVILAALAIVGSSSYTRQHGFAPM
jgi:hypothetical protein